MRLIPLTIVINNLLLYISKTTSDDNLANLLFISYKYLLLGLRIYITLYELKSNNLFYFNIFRISDSIMYLLSLNRLKTFQTLSFIAMIPTCFGLNVLGYLNTNELIYVYLVGIVKSHS